MMFFATTPAHPGKINGAFRHLTENSKKIFIERMDKMSRGINVPPTVELEVLNKGLRLIFS